MHWYKRRQERKAAVRAARVLLALDDLGRVRGIRTRRVARASLGAAR